jgi:Na+/H+ antiporter NhaC
MLSWLIPSAYAAADAAIVNAAADVATGMKENMLGILTNAIFLGILVGIPALFFGIRLARRWVFRGR